MLQKIRHSEKNQNLIFVGIHARRGDRIQKWKQRKMFRDTVIGTYEGKFFNHAMDIFRSRYNNNNQKVIFLPTSDDYFWIKKHLINKNDIYFSRELIKETRVALPNKNEILQLWNHEDLAVKGKNLYCSIHFFLVDVELFPSSFILFSSTNNHLVPFHVEFYIQNSFWFSYHFLFFSFFFIF